MALISIFRPLLRTKRHFPSGAFLFRWCIVISISLVASIVLLARYRSTIGDKFQLGAFGGYGQIPDSNVGNQISDSKIGDADDADSGKEIPVKSFAELACPPWDNDKVNVHFIMHTHNDPGWLKTPDRYYDEDVRHILNNVIEQLMMEPHRKFVYSELYYFDKWWSSQTERMKDNVGHLVKNGQLEFVGGGWVQNDDASTHYTAMIDQLAYGWGKIDQFFGEGALPKTGWHIDNFGFSLEQAAIFEQVGMEETVINRLHHKQIERRRQSKEMEFMWQISPTDKLFSHVLFDHYSAPNGFRFEMGSSFPSEKTKELVAQKTMDLLGIVGTRIQSYRTNHLLVILGDDFTHKDAAIWFRSIDQVIRIGNTKQINGANVQLFYSNPSCYFKAVRESAKNRNIDWQTHSGDFFPYATNPRTYWTGFYSSRVNLKRVIRMANNYMLTAQSLAASIDDHLIGEYLNRSKEALYVTLHHDAITGTCQQAVANEYLRFALRSIDYSQKAITRTLPKLAGGKSETAFEFCLLSKVSICNITQESDLVSIAILNGFSQNRTSFIRIPIDGKANYDLVDAESNPVPFQIFPVTDEIGQFKLKGQSDSELGFFAELPALGFRIYRLKKNAQKTLDGDHQQNQSKLARGNTSEVHSIENEYYKLEIHENGRLNHLTDKKNKGTRHRLVQEFLWYTNHESGAYIFRPEEIVQVTNQSVKVERIENGPLVQEIRQTFANWATQIIRLYNGKPYVEFEWTVGPLEENSGKEVITRFYTDLKSEGIFYTDANGRRLMQRKRDPAGSVHPVAASYYPITTMAGIKANKTQLSIISDRALGASSVVDGSLEVMIHRKVTHDDGAGMGEGLNERDENNRPIVVRGKIWLTLTPIDQAEHLWRNLAKEMFYEPIVAFSRDHLEQWPNKISMLRQPVPSPVHLLTIQRLGKDFCLVRFEHFQSDDNSGRISIQFQELFRGLKLESCSSTQLGGWNRNKKGHSGMIAHLRPMDIVTFKCQCRSK